MEDSLILFSVFKRCVQRGYCEVLRNCDCTGFAEIYGVRFVAKGGEIWKVTKQSLKGSYNTDSILFLDCSE